MFGSTASVGTTGDVDMDKLLQECLDVMHKKGLEYVNGSPDRLENFRGVARDCGITQQQAWYAFFNKHVRAIASYCRIGKVISNEPIRERIKDAIVYLLLAGKMVTEEERASKPTDGKDAVPLKPEEIRRAMVKHRDGLAAGLTTTLVDVVTLVDGSVNVEPINDILRSG